MPYKSDQQRRYMHAVHPEIAARWDAEIRASRKKKKISKARKDYAPKPMMRAMTDEQLARAKDRQKIFSLTGSGLGLTGLGLLGAGAALKGKNPAKAAKLNRASVNTSVTAGGIGALSGINFARIQGEESRRTREIKKSNYGTGYSKYYSDPTSVEEVPVRTQVRDKDWRAKSPYTISRKASDPERSRERRARAYPLVMGAGALGTGALTAHEATKPKAEATRFLDKKILRSKPLRVGAAGAATAALASGAIYNARENNRRSYVGEWYPQRER